MPSFLPLHHFRQSPGPRYASLITGANPRDGSSSISSLGFSINARPMASICCSPPEAGCGARFRETASQADVGAKHSGQNASPCPGGRDNPSSYAAATKGEAFAERHRGARASRTANASPLPLPPPLSGDGFPIPET